MGEKKIKRMPNTSFQSLDLEVLRFYMSCLLILSRMDQDPLQSLQFHFRVGSNTFEKYHLGNYHLDQEIDYNHAPEFLFVFHLSYNSLSYGKDFGPFQVGQKIGSSLRFHYPGRRKWLQLSGITPLQKSHLIGKCQHIFRFEGLFLHQLIIATYLWMMPRYGEVRISVDCLFQNYTSGLQNLVKV